MIIGTLENGNTCVYDLPKEIKTVKQLTSLITGYNNNPRQREELQGQQEKNLIFAKRIFLKCVRIYMKWAKNSQLQELTKSHGSGTGSILLRKLLKF